MRIVFSTFGTAGDVNPLIGLSLELKRRGHTPVIAAPELFRSKVEPLGLEFAAVRPDQDPTNRQLVAMIYDIKHGTERGLREFLFPSIRESYQDLLAAVTAKGGADLLVAGELAYAAPIVAEVTGIRWASYVLAPFSFFSAYDPPVLPPYPGLSKAQSILPGMGRLIAHFARHKTRDWPEPIYALRRELGLARGRNPIFDAKHSDALVLALFSRVLGEPQRDWPRQTRVTGFVYYDGDAGAKDLSPELKKFLLSGEPPIVFTLGSAAVLDPGNFYEVSARVAERLGRRAVLLVGSDAASLSLAGLPPSIFVASYAPYSQIMPYASVIVHQGGVGTTAQALRAGRPMLVMPYSHDQPDNARRVERLGVAQVVRRSQYSVQTAERALRKLFADPAYARRAAQVAEQVRSEDGLPLACDAIEALLAQRQ